MRNFVIGCLLVVSTFSPAFAGWNGVEWGMTEAQVRKVFPQATEKSTGVTYYLNIDGLFYVGEQEFLGVSFYFDTKGQLKAVSTKLRVPYNDVEKRMAVQFGAPVLSDKGDLMGMVTKSATFRDLPNKNVIDITAYENPKNTLRETLVTYKEVESSF